MSKRARHQPGFYATLLNDVRRRGYNLKYRPKLKPTVMGVYEVERIVAKLQGGRAEYFIQWQSYFPSEILREQICRSISRQWMAGETSSFIWEGFKIAPDVQRNYHDTARCSASALSWFALRPPWVSVPRQWRGTDSSRPWSLSEEVFNSNRRWMSRRRSSQLEVASWQVAFLRRWTRPQNSSPPSRESSDQVYWQRVISPDASSEPNAAFMKKASLEATKWNKSLWATVVFIHSYTVTYW